MWCGVLKEVYRMSRFESFSQLLGGLLPFLLKPKYIAKLLGIL